METGATHLQTTLVPGSSVPEELQLGTALEQSPEAVDVEIGVIESEKPQLGQRDLPAAATVESRKNFQVRAGFEQRIISVQAKGAIDARMLVRRRKVEMAHCPERFIHEFHVAHGSAEVGALNRDGVEVRQMR